MLQEQQELVYQYRQLALSIARKFTSLDQDEARAQAMYGLVVAAVNYDVETKNPFLPYARKIITTELVKMYHTMCRSFPTIDFQAIESSQEEYNAEQGENAFYIKLIDLAAEDCYEKFEMIDCIKSYFRTLEPVEKILFRMKMKGFNQDQCSKALAEQGIKMSQSTVNRKLKEMRLSFEYQLRVS